MAFHVPIFEERPYDDLSKRRAHGRRLQESLKSTLGQVMDISRGGVRVLSRKPIEGEQDMSIFSCDGDIDVTARVRWSRKVGFRKYEVGLEFVEVDDETADKLTVISTLHQFACGKTG